MDLFRDGQKKKTVLPTDLSKRLTIDNNPGVYQVYRIRLDMLYYNDQNDRIATWLSEYEAAHPQEKLSSMEREQYNDLIHKFITDSNPDALRKTQNNIAAIGQDTPGVVLKDGRIIDGNRRFTCLRNLQAKGTKPLFFEAVILDYDIEHNKKQIKRLELQLQHGVDKPVDYDPIDRLVGVYHDIVETELLTVQEYASSIDQSEADVQREVEKAKLMVEYLEFINAPKQFHLARTMNLNDPLKELYAILKKCKDPDKREDLKNVVFANFLMQPHGDMTRYIRKIKKIAGNEKFLDDYLEEQMQATEKVCDLLEAQPVVTETVINEKIKPQEELRDTFAHSTEKWVSKVDGDATRNRPAQQAEKAFEMLDTIDTNIFRKLTEEQREDVRSKLDLVQGILDTIRGKLDV